MVVETTTLSRSQQKTQRKQRFYRGELEKMHGPEEVAWLIKKGKLEREVDSDGDECWVKKSYWQDLRPCMSHDLGTYKNDHIERLSCNSCEKMFLARKKKTCA